MNTPLDKTLRTIGRDYANKISRSSRIYIEVDIGEKAAQLGFTRVGIKYRKVLAVVPVKQAEQGMNVRIDGRTFVHYCQLTSGIAVPGHVIKKCNLPFETYIPRESMILNFT